MGFKGALVPAPTPMAYVTELLVSIFGETWLDKGSLKVRFRRPVYNQEEVLVKALFRERLGEHGGSSVFLDVFLEKSDGDVAVLGETVCPIAVAL